MDPLLELNRLLHIVFAVVGLAAWWVPILTRKGGQQHQLFGKTFGDLKARATGVGAEAL